MCFHYNSDKRRQSGQNQEIQNRTCAERRDFPFPAAPEAFEMVEWYWHGCRPRRELWDAFL
jgi:hypothetical protein